jgi:hypothetical protein
MAKPAAQWGQVREIRLVVLIVVAAAEGAGIVAASIAPQMSSIR